MFLKRIDLFGFKSFADKSSIEFTDGISALLGPNGCGKSNVVDAVKWVLGEQSARSLRADKMDDVIFSGTETRNALNVAEVTLTLSNDEGLLPIDLAELSVKRRLYRSGESEYFVNNEPALLREVRELFFDTGIGKSAYSIMEQGKIDQLLSNKPEERRYVFEEAAGITKYKSRGAEAERDLSRTEENMKQVEQILKEVRRTYDSLRSQAEKTGVYRDLREQIFDLELKQQLMRLREFLERDRTKSQQLDSAVLKRDSMREKLESQNKSMEAELDAVNRLETELVSKQNERYRFELEISNYQSRVQLQSERVAEIKRALGHAKERHEAVTLSFREASQQIENRTAALAEITGRIGEIEENIASFEQTIGSARDRTEGNDATIADAGATIQSLDQQSGVLREELRILYDDIVTQLDTRLKETGYSHQRRKMSEDRLDEVFQGVRIHLSGRIKILDDAVGLDAGSDPRSLAESTLSALRELELRVSSLSEALVEFRSNVPEFIDEFLAPAGIITKKREIDGNISKVDASIDTMAASIERLRAENAELRKKIETYGNTLEELRLNRERIRAQRLGVEESIALLTRQRRESERQMAEGRGEIDRSSQQLLAIEAEISSTKEKRLELQARTRSLGSSLGGIESDIAKRSKKLLDREIQKNRGLAQLTAIQESVEKLRIDQSTVQTEIKNLYDNFADRYSTDLRQYEQQMYEIEEEAHDLRQSLSERRQAIRELGSVNLMATEEFAETKERFDFLNGQLEDLKSARSDMRSVTEQIRTESTELFLETYDRIKRNFHSMFRRLFGGGRAELMLSDPDNVLTSGIDILAQPPGKQLESVDLLSGGEKSLAAVALLFATFVVKPSPFCILDEIDAALDEENVGRFVGLLKEFAETSQFIVITHNKRTVTSAESLLGVTMEESGVSQIIAVRLGEPVRA